MKARTHTELYRRFEGERRGVRLALWPLVASGVAIACKRKLPLLLFFLPPGITAVIFSFLVHGKYAGEAALAQPTTVVQMFTRAVAQQVAQRIEVAETIAEANDVMLFFALLAVAWYGSGAIAEDRRLGAHLLYFSRPLSRLDYVLGKFLQVACFGALASIAPGLVICLVAAFSSPDWSFLRDEGEVIAQTLAYGGIWVAVTTSVVLAASAVCGRRTHALAAYFGFFMINHVLGSVFTFANPRYEAASLLNCLASVRGHIFDVAELRALPFEPRDAYLVLFTVVALGMAIVAARVRRLEVVA